MRDRAKHGQSDKKQTETEIKRDRDRHGLSDILRHRYGQCQKQRHGQSDRQTRTALHETDTEIDTGRARNRERHGQNDRDRRKTDR